MRTHCPHPHRDILTRTHEFPPHHAPAPPPHFGNGGTECVFPKSPARNKEKDLSVLTLQNGLMLKEGGGGGGAEKARITKEKGLPVLTLHTGLMMKGVCWEHAYVYPK